MSALRPLDLNDHTITEKIYFIRGQKVMLDRDLAVMYDVPTKALKQAGKIKEIETQIPVDVFDRKLVDELGKYL